MTGYGFFEFTSVETEKENEYLLKYSLFLLSAGM
jgi:hypothetical protein